MDRKIAKAMFSCIHKKPRPRQEVFSDFFKKLGSEYPNLDTMREDRQCRQIVADLIAMGYPIISTSKGYCLAVDEATVNEAQAQIKAKIKALQERWYSQARTFAKVKGQKTLKFEHYWQEK